jgi:hypothetical protein
MNIRHGYQQWHTSESTTPGRMGNLSDVSDTASLGKANSESAAEPTSHEAMDYPMLGDVTFKRIQKAYCLPKTLARKHQRK